MIDKIKKIKSDLQENKISYGEGFELIKLLPKPWQEKSWKEKREKIIKSYCEQCGEKNGIMVLQHMNHHVKFKEIKSLIFTERFNNFYLSYTPTYQQITNEEINQHKARYEEERLACPKCERQSISKRKKIKPEYRCSTCYHEFETPKSIRYNTLYKENAAKVNLNDLLLARKKHDAFLEIRNQKYWEWDNEIGREALLIDIDNYLDYLSLRDTVTFCKKCANLMDRWDKLLCYSCKKNYYNYFLYTGCYICHESGIIGIPNPFQEKISIDKISSLDMIINK